MNATKLEKTVKKNALKLEKKIDTFTANNGQYIVFNGNESLFSDSFSTAVEAGEKTFGKNSGFVVRKVGALPTLSALIKL